MKNLLSAILLLFVSFQVHALTLTQLQNSMTVPYNSSLKLSCFKSTKPGDYFLNGDNYTSNMTETSLNSGVPTALATNNARGTFGSTTNVQTVNGLLTSYSQGGIQLYKNLTLTFSYNFQPYTVTFPANTYYSSATGGVRNENGATSVNVPNTGINTNFGNVALPVTVNSVWYLTDTVYDRGWLRFVAKLPDNTFKYFYMVCKKV
jgi:hypothetical protein